MSTISLKFPSNTYTEEYPRSDFLTASSPYPPIPGPTPGLTALTTARPPPPTEPLVNWLPITPRPGCPCGTRNNVEAPSFTAIFKTLSLALLIAVILEICWFLYKHIQEVNNIPIHQTDEDFEPRTPMFAPRENRPGYLGSQESIPRGLRRWGVRNATEGFGSRGRERRTRGAERGQDEVLELRASRNRGGSEDEVLWDQAWLSPIAETTGVSSP